MKLLSFALLCLTQAFATYAGANRVGDTITLSGNFSGSTLEIVASYETYQNGSILQRTVTKINGMNAGTEDSWLAEEDILTPETAGLMVAMCPALGGDQVYLDLPVGRTLTCRLNTANLRELPYALSKSLQNLGEMVWLAPFPVLGVAQVQVEGAYLQVSGYTWN